MTHKHVRFNIVTLIILTTFALSWAATSNASSLTPAFPEAQGFGAYSQGGRGGDIFLITNTEDYGPEDTVIPGSLRQAVEAKGPRTVIFRVSGVIALKQRLQITNPYITIAGQSAPGAGICLKDDQFSINADHVIVRHIRSRLGDKKRTDLDAISVGGGSHIIFDHCSASWSTDETFSAQSKNFTMQNCIVSEGLYNSYHPKGTHSMGSVIKSIDGSCSILNNLYAHNNGRNPKLNLGDMRNNLIYDWGGIASYGPKQALNRVNLVANYYKPGPSTENEKLGYNISGDLCRLYVEGNYHEGNPAVMQDNWNLILNKLEGLVPDKSKSPHPYPAMKTVSPQDVYQAVLKNAGATLPQRDSVDQRIVNDVRQGTGRLIDSQNDVGGWPIYASSPAPLDEDKDGMPDGWESKHNLNPGNSQDHKADADGDGFSNVEEYLNDTDPNQTTSYLISYPDFQAARVALDEANLRDDKLMVAIHEARAYALANPAIPKLDVSLSPETKHAERINVRINDKVTISMKLIPAGSFMMGSPEDEAGREEQETQHKVTLTRPFYMGITEVTEKQFSEIVKNGKGDRENKAASMPWHDAELICKILSKNSANNFRLPTESEWEYACRAGTTTPYFTGQTISRDYANYNTREEGIQTGLQEAGSTKPNPWGLHDMPGSLFEWCSDWEGPYPKGPVTDPQGPDLPDNPRKRIRGGKSSSSWEYVRSAYRYRYQLTTEHGFRLVMDVPE